MPKDTDIYYLYGVNVNELIAQINNDDEPISDNPDVCDNCGGDIQWEDEDVMSLVIKGACTKCGREVSLNE